MFNVVIITGDIDSTAQSLISSYKRRFDAEVFVACNSARLSFPFDAVDDSQEGRAELEDHVRSCDLVLEYKTPQWAAIIVKQSGKPAVDISKEHESRSSAQAGSTPGRVDDISLLTARLEDREQKLAHASARIDSLEEIARTLRNELHQ